ncbi:coat protein [Beauveria bassiana victorivirus 1]|uniref:Coat protein n=1 Tax=Beauveria bassiana victorivirus 1 TaxID=1685109 RepID=G3C8V3_9VIRU|nr:coat protein [Beauveria bassiana victorivirus 1]CCC42234.1 coat protein [Beauveria bassiana victorivirus 1]
MSTVQTNAFLSGVIANGRGALLTADNQFRRYAANTRSSATIGGNEDARLARIFYEVGRVHSTKARALAAAPDGLLRVDAAYPTTGTLAEEFIGLAKKYTNFSATFEYSSLAGIVERIAKGLASQSVFGNVDTGDLAAGRPIIVNALGTFDGPVNSLTNTVFIPRLVNSSVTGDVFSVLVHAAAGEGAAIATDLLELDAATRQPILTVVDADGLARACVEALRLLGTNMMASNQGPLFALALCRGLHQVVTVVGHTDEGGIVRDLLRHSAFGVPFGGIHFSLEPYAGLPALATNSVPDVCSYVDALALSSAALVAHADPGQLYDGRWYPTFYSGTSSDDVEVRPGGNLPGTDDMARRNRSQLIGGLSRFSEVYVRGLAQLFACPGDSRVASTFFNSSVANIGVSRHLRYASVAPYFWIEPTSLIPHDFLGTDAEAFGSGALATKDVPRTKGFFEDCWASGVGDAAFSGYHVMLRNPRSAWFFAHWLNHPRNGLGGTQVRQLDPNAIIHPGGHATLPDIRDRVEMALPWTDYLWTRGQSPFNAPGEFLNLAGTAGFMVNHYTFDEDGIPQLEHLPTAREFASGEVTISVGRPQGLANGPSNWGDSNARRARTRATRELAASAARVRAFGRPDVAEMPILTTAPQPRGSRVRPEPARANDQAGVGGWRRASNSAGSGEAVPEPFGVPRDVVPQHQAVRYPVLARNLGAGGGVAHIPPPNRGPEGGENVDPVAIAGAAPPGGPNPE